MRKIRIVVVPDKNTGIVPFQAEVGTEQNIRNDADTYGKLLAIAVRKVATETDQADLGSRCFSAIAGSHDIAVVVFDPAESPLGMTVTTHT